MMPWQKIVSDTAGEPQPRKIKNNRSAAQQVGTTLKSARPRKITYVPIDESEFEPIVITRKEKSIKALKVNWNDRRHGFGSGRLCICRSILLLHQSFL